MQLSVKAFVDHVFTFVSMLIFSNIIKCTVSEGLLSENKMKTRKILNELSKYLNDISSGRSVFIANEAVRV